MTITADEAKLTPGMPPPDGQYFARVQFGRQPGEGETEETLYLDFQYPSLPYGAMVGIQKLLAEGALQDLVAMGELVAEEMGQPVQSATEIREDLKKAKEKRGQGQGRK